jgi:hypothetical protein
MNGSKPKTLNSRLIGILAHACHGYSGKVLRTHYQTGSSGASSFQEIQAVAETGKPQSARVKESQKTGGQPKKMNTRAGSNHLERIGGTFLSSICLLRARLLEIERSKVRSVGTVQYVGMS